GPGAPGGLRASEKGAAQDLIAVGSERPQRRGGQSIEGESFVDCRMALAEGRTLQFVGPDHIDVAVLETFDYDGPTQEIVTETGEFTAVCPYSGLPDFAGLTITYVPQSRCVELKSLKYYVTSFRNVGIFQEHATARIAEDLFRLLAPRSLSVRTVYNV